MGNMLSGSEIVAIGIQIEKNGRDFYDALVKQAKNKKAGEKFEYLKGEEEKHIKVFQEILEKLPGYEQAESYPGEYVAYMNDLAGNYIFTKKDRGIAAAKNAKTDLEAVEFGIGFEKDSIIFYEGMKKIMPEYDIKVVEELIRQEQTHLRQLFDLKNSLSGL